MRLDKKLADALNITRSEAKAAIKQKAVCVNGRVITAADFACSDSDSITLNGQAVNTQTFVYIMMNKPQGVISASDGKGEPTVLDLLPDAMRRKGLFPAGRLDKDTTGFMLITNDGVFAHNLLSPSKHVDKTYLATLDKPVDDRVIADFENGMELNGERLLQASLRPLNTEQTVVEVVLRQGLYHQVKRMFLKHGITVTALRRTAIGQLPLDPALREGDSRYLTAAELQAITA
ncbi:MAG: rRNA pseudouridine synthase [Eubacterium sp.]|nr:rRNA pseudouridine synthase [Eubacterium sp.]